jgi:hypothetical protein
LPIFEKLNDKHPQPSSPTMHFSLRPSRRSRSPRSVIDILPATQTTSTNLNSNERLPTSAAFSQVAGRKSLRESLNIPDVRTSGESGRSGFHFVRFFQVIFRSSCTASAVCNILWPVVPAALAVTCESLSLPCQIAAPWQIVPGRGLSKNKGSKRSLIKVQHFPTRCTQG